MPQKPAYSEPEIIAAGMTLRMQGIEPTQASLYRALDCRGHPSTHWKAWLRHVSGANDNCPPLFEGAPEAMSAEMTEVHRMHGMALAKIRECTAREAVEPLNRRITALDKALDDICKDRDQLQDLVDVLYEEISTLRAANETLQRAAAPQPSLILPTPPKPPRGAI
ncbi:DNA-binding protein [Limimaricola sp. G21655-S1]|uniref:DNA-binding protein n=1 Tax=Limimaricola sp. G21655-S1 TaxID=3014768 RepID=UPI0022AFB141|nr:DNA-binding protein [Limimaricola sp. G21655-S1]MCZ4262668.1 DNA-binding protein [Limimaricola sp. G21655-S1]